MVRDWPGLIGTTIVLFLLGLLGTLFPMKVIWFALNWPKWAHFGLIRDEDYPPSMRNAKQLFDNDRKKFKKEYLWLIFLVRFLGLGPLFMSCMIFLLIILPALSNDGILP